MELPSYLCLGSLLGPELDIGQPLKYLSRLEDDDDLFGYFAALTQHIDQETTAVVVLYFFSLSSQFNSPIQGAKIVINIRNSLKAKFDNLIKEWGLFCISNVAVVDSPLQFRTKHIQHEYKLMFTKKTTVVPFPPTEWRGTNGFSFNPFDVLRSRGLKVGVLTNVIGRVANYSEVQDFRNTDKLSVSTNWKNTNVLIDTDHPQIVEFRQRLTQIHSSEDSICSLAPSLSISSARDPKSFFKKAQYVVLDRLNPSMEGIYIIQATINTILPDDTWYCIACKKCNKSAKPVIPNCDLSLDVDQLLNLERKCYSCIDKPEVVVRFKVPIRVENQTGTTSFTVFESVVKKYVTPSAYELIKALFEDDDYHEELELLLQKTLLFKIDVSAYNKERGIRNYTVKDATDDSTCYKRYESFKCASNASRSQTIDLSHDTCFSPPLKKIKQERIKSPPSVKSSTTKGKFSNRPKRLHSSDS
ncbi:uncharacterized protein [Rutidosis leptorrhynchoides]|uniref:uncharacterized protein n=1 Tax=Rutidosis leptorrhynchoides TaxID=125765 RepID=UPI003A98F84D